ncbi:hypothetical protein [Mesorhizobium wenxiniae]|uniref:Uncharacterized protein n=1 Tax=Mesorhizobium wenxiniae TaxID=2014805 RepID=A0A271K6K5_9HYPH|nr:hypothetical protein [Mesorhizobium wenxiniae]PAP91393.1 hypothetical protein CIT31_32475 [Mesorhizobium wenxiniae]
MPFTLNLDVRGIKPIAELTDEQAEFKWQIIIRNLSVDEEYRARKAQREAEDQARADFLKKRHEYFLNDAGAKNSAMSVASAKKYVRARAAASLRMAFEVFEETLHTGKVADRLDVANEIIKRAVGPAAVPNSITAAKELTELAPTEAIDTVLQAYAKGECDEHFVKTLLGLLGAKVNGLRLEQAGAKRSADKVGNPIGKPPSGKVV